MSETKLLMEAINLEKHFPGVKALDKVSLQVKSGEVLGLVGENGAGKSTLVKIIGGVYPKDAGELRLNGKPLTHLSPSIAQRLGIAIMHQELNLVPYLSVAQNIFLGREPTRRIGILDRKEMDRRAQAILATLGVSLDTRRLVAGLSIAEKQLVEIAKALSRDAKVIIMDEPTATLTQKETDNLFRIVKELKRQKKGVIYITHRIEELVNVADRVVVLRDGRIVGEGQIDELGPAQIIKMMVGREINEQYPYRAGTPGREVLRLENIRRHGVLHDVSLSLRAGEVLGIFGLVGAGRTELARAVIGVDKISGGRVIIDGQVADGLTPQRAISKGIFYLPEDRKNQGLFLERSVRSNTIVSSLRHLSGWGGVIDYSKANRMVVDYVQRFSIHPAAVLRICKHLSGGNQQKVLLARAVMTKPRILILDEPTRGIDVGSKTEIYNLINKLKADGVGIIVITSDLPEALGISDRLFVMREGRITAEFAHSEANQERVMEFALGTGGKS